MKGDKIRQPYSGAHLRTNIMGMIMPREGEFSALEVSHCDMEVSRSSWTTLNQDIELKRPRNILVMDNASWHKSKSLKWGRFEPLFLPPYSPDLNPIERLWLILKAQWFSGFYAKSLDELIEKLTLGLRWLIDRKDENRNTCSVPTEI
jgi:transposase